MTFTRYPFPILLGFIVMFWCFQFINVSGSTDSTELCTDVVRQFNIDV